MAIRNDRSQTKEAVESYEGSGARSQELGASRRSQEPGSDERARSEKPRLIRKKGRRRST